jgi:glycosyltransferase involved in cell wall biosynthesis
VRPTPILFLGDSPSAPSGLGRICRDLLVRLNEVPEFRVGVIGKGGIGSARFRFPHYHVPAQTMEFGESIIEEAWYDFAGNEHGVVFAINDPSRMLWLGQPKYCDDERLQRFLEAGHFSRWLYPPVDGTGIADRLTAPSRDTLAGFDRVIAYTDWAAGVIERSVGTRPPSLPHGIDLDVFRPHEKIKSRQFLEPKLGADDFVVGIVATNQSRKDWGLGLTVVAKLRERMSRPVRVWIHTDTEIRHWSIPALVADLGLEGNVVLTMHKMTDAEMAKCYSACDVTLGIGLGEGFGYPLVESLACGVPVIHGLYGGGAEFVPQHLLVRPVSYRLETICNRVCPVFDPEDWAKKVMRTVVGDSKQGFDYRHAVEHLDWRVLWPRWEFWFKEGLK